MAHNLHLMVVKATTGKEACNIVDSEINDWGNENNWRAICGAVSEDNKVHVHDKNGRWNVKEFNTIDKINVLVEGWVNGKDPIVESGLETVKKYLADPNAKIKPTEWYAVETWAKEMGEQAQHKIYNKGKIDVLTMSFYEYDYTECGVTQCALDNTGKKWVVFIDMHS